MQVLGGGRRRALRRAGLRRRAALRGAQPRRELAQRERSRREGHLKNQHGFVDDCGRRAHLPTKP